jgi:E3 ubiquitin-protein ligase RNF144
MADLVVVNDVFLIALCNRRKEANTAGLLAIPDEEYAAELQLQEVIMSILPLLVDSFAPAANNDVELLG